MKRLTTMVVAALVVWCAGTLAWGAAGTTITASKTAEGSFLRAEYAWTISKTVTPDSWDLFTGDTGTSSYEITLTKGSAVITRIDNVPAVMQGLITVTNTGGVATTGLVILDNVIGKAPGGNWAPVPGPGVIVSTRAHPVLLPGESYSYPYVVKFVPLPGYEYRNRAYVTITNFVGHIGFSFGVTAEADPTPLTGGVSNDTVHVTDSYAGGPQNVAVSDSTVFTYTRTFSATGTYTNTAKITETGQSDDATVEVEVNDLSVSKTAQTNSARTYVWDIIKGVSQPTTDIYVGDTMTVLYDVTATATLVDSQFKAEGVIVIVNPSDRDALVTVSDVISPDIVATLDPAGPTYTVPADDTLTISYTADLPDGTDRTNKVTVSLQNYAFAPDGSATPTGTTDYSATAEVDFDDPGAVTDETVNVEDSWYGDLGQVTAPGTTFYYERTFGPYDDPASICDKNKATLELGDGSELESEAEVCFDVWALCVEKDCRAELVRTYEWTIAKTCECKQTALGGAPVASATASVEFTVTVNATPSDGGFAVEGTITIKNPSPLDVYLLDLTDVLTTPSGNFDGTVDPGPWMVPAGGTLDVKYKVILPDDESGVNVATATIQNYNYYWDGSVTEIGTTSFDGECNVDFASATVAEFNTSMDVYDQVDAQTPTLLGTVLAADVPVTIKYTVQNTAYLQPTP
jgi:hypothetical protein